MAKKKRLRLKKKYRRILHYVKGTAYSILAGVIVANIVPIPAGSAVMTVNAESTTNETIKVMAKLQHRDLNDAKVLKEYVVSSYASDNNADDLSVSNTKVIMKSPAVVTTPTIDNSNFVVIPTQTESDIQTSVTFTPDKTESADDDSKEEAKPVEVPQETAEPVQETKPVETAQPEKSETRTEEETVKETEKKEEAAPETESLTKTASSAPALAAEVTDLDETTAIVKQDDAEKTEASLASAPVSYADNFVTENGKGLQLVLKSENVLLDDASEFDAHNYVVATNSSDGVPPVLKIDGSVNSYKDGKYDITYTIVDASGETVSAVLHVTVKTPQDMEEIQKAKVEKAVNEYAAKLDGHAYDMDGYYGDQCWDLWAKYCYDHKLKFDDSTQPYGYAYGVSLKYKTSGASKYFDAVGPDDLECGDWLFWDKGSSCADSHVALLLKNNGDGTGVCLTQSKGNGTRIMTLQLDVMKINFRPSGNNAWYNYS